MGVARQNGQDDVEGELSQQNAIRISHSLPDLQSEPITHEYVQEQKDNKKVQVPDRHKVACTSVCLHGFVYFAWLYF